VELIPRAYQLAIYNSIMQKGNTLVVLPTGLGKTLIGLMLIKERMAKGRCLFMTPTKPLAKQHRDTIISTLGLEQDEVVLVNGEVPPAKRKEAYRAKVVISTPQTIRNDLMAGLLEPSFSLAIFDECHRAVGNYAYTYVAEKLAGKETLFVGLTASPGGRRDRIKEVMGALSIANVEIRGHDDADVSPYVQKSTITWVPVDLSDHFKAIRKELETLTGKYAQRLGGMGFPPPLRHKGNFLALGERIRNIPHNIKYPALVQYYVLLHLLHMTELLETQGIYPLREYIAKMEAKEGKSAKLLLNEQGMAKVKELSLKDEDHPKMKVLVETVGRLSAAGKKMMVFVQYRSQIARIEDVLKANGISAKRFVGKKDGVTKKMQEETIAEFREGKFDVMVASSIGEEGLDIPAVDAVIFYEPVPSEIRSIQRRGRAARLKEGEVIVLMTKGTRDEYYHYASQNREKKMKSILHGMKRTGIGGMGTVAGEAGTGAAKGAAKRPDDSFIVAEELRKTSGQRKGHATAEQKEVRTTTEQKKVHTGPKALPPKKGQTKMSDF
jgi:Fanconi anemia group M protein